ncbi:MAG: glycine zipper 2TM domain-containing protein [Novosphingobium sp.]|nr:glycine zipper 2TM domain-containing protein [Novosphingobium sp.]
MLARLTIAALVLGATASPAFAGGARVPAGVPYAAGPVQGPAYYPPMAGPPYPTVVMAQPANATMQPPHGYPQAYPQGYPQNAQAYPPVAQGGYPAPDPRWGEMNERCAKIYGDRHVGGTVLGGVAGGVVGNRVARAGSRVLGTVIGGVVGAIAGNMIDKGEDKNLRRECDDYFAALPPQGAPGYYPGFYPGSYPGYPPAPYGYMWVPVISGPQKPCLETTVVTEKWVSVPARHRVIHRRIRIVPDKRVKEKRVYTG